MEFSKGSEDFKVGIYVRESRDDYEENYDTIETQKELLVDFVKKNEIGTIYKIYMDDNVSGAAFERNGLEMLKNDVKSFDINFLVIKDLSRLGRNNAKTLLFLDFLEEYGVRVMTLDGRYDSIKDNDTVGIDTWFNERYIRDISKKIRTNLRFKIEKGEYIGHAPYGYVKSVTAKNKLCIDAITADVVREIFDLYLEGYGYSYIAKLLDKKGFPTPSKRNSVNTSSGSWNAVAIRRILGNRVYIGDTVQGISEKVSFKSKKTRRLPMNRWVLTKNTHEEIVSKEVFEEVQRIRSRKIMIDGPHKEKLHLLKGIVFCGKCGSMMYARSRKERPLAYICGAYVKNGKSVCTSHHIREKEVGDILIKELISLLEDEELRTKIAEVLEKECYMRENTVFELNNIEQLLISKQRQQDILYMDKLEGKISEQLFTRTNSNIENRITQLRHEMELIRKKETKETKESNGKELILQTIDGLKVKGMNQEIVRLFVDKIIIFEKGDENSNIGLTGGQKEIAEANGAILIEFKI